MLQCQHNLSTVQGYFLLLKAHPLHQMCEELSTVNVIYNGENIMFEPTVTSAFEEQSLY